MNKKDYKLLLQDTIIKEELSTDEAKQKYLSLLNCVDKIRPKKLFRYRTCSEFSFNSLIKDKIFFNTPNNFNDPHDCLSFVDVEKIKNELKKLNPTTEKNILIDMRKSSHLKKEEFSPNILSLVENKYNAIKNLSCDDFNKLISEIEKDEDYYQKLKDQMISLIDLNHKNFITQSKNNTYVACLSEVIKSTLMWAHYADYHKGFALEYDTGELLDLERSSYICKDSHITNLYPIIYGNERYDATIYEIETLNYLLNGLSIERNIPFILHDKLFYMKSNIYKSYDWKYEKEWRLIFTCKQDHPKDKFEILSPKAIYFGVNMTDSNKEIISKLIENKNIKKYQMYIKEDSKKYELSYKKIE